MVVVTAGIAAVLFWFWIDSAAFSYLFTRFNVPLPAREARSLRALTYLLAVVNWNLGSAAVVLLMHRSKGVPLAEALSTIFYYKFFDGIVLAGFALIGGVILQNPDAHRLAWLAAALLGLQVITLVLVHASARARWRWARRLAQSRILRTYGLASGRDAVLVLGLRIIYFAGFTAFYWVTLPAFGALVPLPQLIVTAPIVAIVGAVPITPAGLGTQQAALLYFYGGYGPEAGLLAFGLLFPVVFLLARAALSLVYIRDLAAARAHLRHAA